MKRTAALVALALCLTAGIASAHLQDGNFTFRNSKLFSDPPNFASPLHYQVNQYRPSDALRCWVMSQDPGGKYKCDDSHCTCYENCFLGPYLNPRYVFSIPDGIVHQGACDAGNCFSADYGGIVGLQNLSASAMKITFANSDPTNGKHQEGWCVISVQGNAVQMVAGSWH